MSFDRGEWETRTAERNAMEWPEDAASIFTAPVSRYLIADLEQIAELVSYPDYAMNATGRALLTKEVAKSFRRQMMSTRSPEFAAAVEWCTHQALRRLTTPGGAPAPAPLRGRNLR